MLASRSCLQLPRRSCGSWAGRSACGSKEPTPWLNARLRRTHGARAVSVLASRSRDGSLVSGYVSRFGLDVVRGSSSRGGAAALRALVTAVRGGRDVVLVPDGPRGPRGQLGPGVVALAD